MATRKQCIEVTVEHQYLIIVEQAQNKTALFTVTYWLQVMTGLTYIEAMTAFGKCVFHVLACNGQLNNEGK